MKRSVLVLGDRRRRRADRRLTSRRPCVFEAVSTGWYAADTSNGKNKIVPAVVHSN